MIRNGWDETFPNLKFILGFSTSIFWRFLSSSGCSNYLALWYGNQKIWIVLAIDDLISMNEIPWNTMKCRIYEMNLPMHCSRLPSSQHMEIETHARDCFSRVKHVQLVDVPAAMFTSPKLQSVIYWFPTGWLVLTSIILPFHNLSYIPRISLRNYRTFSTCSSIKFSSFSQWNPLQDHFPPGAAEAMAGGRRRGGRCRWLMEMDGDVARNLEKSMGHFWVFSQKSSENVSRCGWMLKLFS